MNLEKQKWTILLPQEELKEKITVLLPEEEFHYASHVLRLGNGAPVRLTNGQGRWGSGILEQLAKKNGSLKITDLQWEDPPKIAVDLWIAHPKNAVLEDVVLSASEIGVRSISIFKSEKSHAKGPLKLEKLEKLTWEALRISKRSWVTKVNDSGNLDTFIKSQLEKSEPKRKIFFCDEQVLSAPQTPPLPLGQALATLSEDIESVALLVGCEGGFSAAERDSLSDRLCPQAVSLGQSVLRVHTAVCAALGSFFCR